MLLRPFRLIFMLGAAFVAGMLYEHERQQQACEADAGLLADALCQ
ncbi:hypothetical protein [Pseudooceanicola sp. HF7]|nr:hypothetical protein [Pseudooceanicola sp. HF7]